MIYVYIHDIYIYIYIYMSVCVCGVFMSVYLCFFFCMCLCLCISVFFGLFVFLLCVILNQSTSQNHVIKVTSSCLNLIANLICATNNSKSTANPKSSTWGNPLPILWGGGVKVAKNFKSFWSLGLVKWLFCRRGC